ncbi:MAG: glycosyltransferase [Planctomycetota bacterium]
MLTAPESGRLSIVIPAFNESDKIALDVETAGRFLTEYGLAGEVIVVDDGSGDRTAQAARRATLPQGVGRRIIRFDRNRGKGRAVRAGVLSSRGDRVLFADSGLCVLWENCLRGLAALQSEDCDIAHGSRRLPGSTIVRPRRLRRRLLSRAAGALLPMAAGVPTYLTDTQCGFKLYPGDLARELYRQAVCDGFLFDVEIILRARRAGYRIREFPIEWRSDPDSRLNPVANLPRLTRDFLAIRRALPRHAGSAGGP